MTPSEGESGRSLEERAEALYLEREYAEAAAHYERAYAAHRQAGDSMGAGRAARSAAWVTGNVLGRWAIQNGWYARALRILEEAGEDRPEYGWVLIIRSFSTPDPVGREALLRGALEIGRRFGDPDLEFDALGYLGALYLLIGRAEEGFALLDETLAVACAGELREVTTVDGLFCGLLWACELMNDVPRAEQWMRAAADVLSRHAVVAAFCRAHYGAILTAAGRWEDAETELIAANRAFEHGTERCDAALIRLSDLRVRQGRLDEAAQLLTGLEQHPDAVRSVAALYFARGETALARDLLERSTAGPDEVPGVGETTMVGPLLALLVDVALADGRVDEAEAAAQRLQRVARTQGGLYLHAAAALAEGQVCVARGEGDARAYLHEALDGFARAQLPMELATARLAMARALAASSPEVAIAEAKSALAAFEGLEAARHADAAAQLLRSLGAPVRVGPKGVGTLTKREQEVLGLLGAGMSNPEIGDRLFITRKTVEHHVGRILAKLGLRNRAEAAAFATREKLSR